MHQMNEVLALIFKANELLWSVEIKKIKFTPLESYFITIYVIRIFSANHMRKGKNNMLILSSEVPISHWQRISILNFKTRLFFKYGNLYSRLIKEINGQSTIFCRCHKNYHTVAIFYPQKYLTCLTTSWNFRNIPYYFSSFSIFEILWQSQLE